MAGSRWEKAALLADLAGDGDVLALKELCGLLGLAYFDTLPRPDLPAHLVEILDVGWARKHRLAPLSAEGDQVLVATPAPLALKPLDELAFAFGRRVTAAGAPEAEVLRALNMLFSERMDSADDVLREMAAGDGNGPAGVEDPSWDLLDSSDEAPVIRLINRILYQAAGERASDVHIEPAAGAAMIRFRIDGLLYDRQSPPLSYLPFIASRVKVMAGLDIAEKRVPQDGRFQFTVAERSIDVRVSIIPTAGGERLVLRLLDKATAMLGMEELGLDRDNLERFIRLIEQPHGIILATGPTGSGKTTTLYGALSRLNTREKKHHHHRGPGGIRPARGGPDSHSPQGRPEFRPGTAFRVAARSGRDHDRGDPRSGNR